MRVLVTGHRGYIGSVMTPMLMKAGHEVVGYDTDLYRRCSYRAGGVAIQGPTIEKDTRDIEVRDLLGFDAVIHLAALPHGNLSPSVIYEVNCQAALRTARMAKMAGVRRFLFASSCSNYGDGGDTLLDETSPLVPATPNGAAQVTAELDLAELADRSFAPTCLRLAAAYGVSPRMRFDLLLNDLVARAATCDDAISGSGCSAWRPLVHVEDISRAFLATLEAPIEAVSNEVFNVGTTAHNYRMRDLIEIVAGIVPGRRTATIDENALDVRSCRLSCEKIRRHLPAFQPVWDARSGAEQLCRAFRSTGLKPEELKAPRYRRWGQIAKLLASGVAGPDLRMASVSRQRQLAAAVA